MAEHDTWVTVAEGAGAPPAWSVAGRYLPRELLGRGGAGVVWRGWDSVREEEVAIKLVGDPGPRLVRELAALRWLQMPGVVRILDDGPADAGWFIVMELVPGAPFPGRTGRLPWAELAPLVFALLDTLDRVHAAGVLHLDLKPPNVLVGQRPVVLDFGIARGAALAPAPAGARELTPRWAAPEQRGGGPVDHRADLYAVGRMVEDALAPGTAPPAVQAVLRALLAPAPEDRPASAEAALRALGGLGPVVGSAGPAAAQPGGAASADPGAAAEEPAAEEPAAPRFAGPDLFTHLHEDAAALLRRRAGADPARVQAELRAWVAAGVARRGPDGLHLDRVRLDALDAASPDGPEERLRGQLRAPPEALLPVVLEVARERLRGGRVTRALAALELGVSVARGAGGPLAGQEELRALWGEAALTQESVPAIERAVYELERAGTPLDHPVLRLLHGARAAYRREGARALALLDGLDGLPEDLETWRQGMRVRAAASLGRETERRLLRELGAWADEPGRRARLDGWWGNLRYRENRFAAAARLHLRAAAAGTRGEQGVIAAKLNAAYAFLDALRPGRAEALAREAQAAAARLRLPTYEGYATWVRRAVAYRRGRAGAPRPELVESAAPVRAHLQAQLALNEAAVAWRFGATPGAAPHPLARPLAELAARLFGELGHAEAALLARALAAAAGDLEPDPRAELVAALGARRWAVPDLGVQALGLLGPWLGEGERGALGALLGARPPSQRRSRLDVTSYAESAAWAGLPAPGPPGAPVRAG